MGKLLRAAVEKRKRYLITHLNNLGSYKDSYLNGKTLTELEHEYAYQIKCKAGGKHEKENRSI
ncbi:hypothetical protein JOC77_000971 [Peribacillus deserti]|uniref:Fur-regulated basic protein FbpA n=1 Tax=Peribacillus deserti TaxID=673318 RepID=A0ABS2QFW0_9BACI|nr:Fur-regulated basic protein FbpA [Peribacillus deserti]MBM7691564.1 hypothetical protein [Peribacillus deserti]